MLDVKFVRENVPAVEESLRRRGSTANLEGFVEIDRKRRALLSSVEALRAERNAASEEIGRLRREKKDASALMEKMKEVAARIKEMEAGLPELERQLEEVLLNIPNVPDPSVPEGAGEEDNAIVRTWGTPASFPFPVRDHVDIGADLEILDFERAAKIAGARFAGAWGRARSSSGRSSTSCWTSTRGSTGTGRCYLPFMVNRESLIGTGQLPKFEEDLFQRRGDRLLPGPDGRGAGHQPAPRRDPGEKLPAAPLLRLHPLLPRRGGLLRQGRAGADPPAPVQQGGAGQVLPAGGLSYAELEVAHPGRGGRSCNGWGFPTGSSRCCTGGHGVLRRQDLRPRGVAAGAGPATGRSPPAATSRTSRPGARRSATARGIGQDAPGHTLNGSGLAVGRTLVAILENYQHADGSVRSPSRCAPTWAAWSGSRGAENAPAGVPLLPGFARRYAGEGHSLLRCSRHRSAGFTSPRNRFRAR